MARVAMNCLTTCQTLLRPAKYPDLSGLARPSSAVPTQEEFIEENVRIKNAIAAAVPTQEKFIEENVHIEVQKKLALPTVSSSFQQALTDSWSRTPGSRTPGSRTPGSRTPGSRTPGHERLSTSRREKNKKKRCLERLNLGETLV
ncbi:hypothetical protein TNCV_583341 [Trichonephila clavipes]|nr:hypothetical protein TNCV_583341 [Trichonephila clavipes]